jgi:periplasmic copper chaperone A
MTWNTPRRLIRGGLAAAIVALIATPASAVNIPEGGAVTPDSVFVIHFQVQEGCEGAPTDGLEVTIPASVSNPQPEQVPGWDVEVTTQGADAIGAQVDAAATAQSDGGSADTGLTVVSWTGSSVQAGAFQEFGLRARFPDDPGATIAFPVLQRCGLVERAFSAGDDLDPAPTVTLSERFGPRDINALSDSVSQLQSDIEELSAQLGGVDVSNLRSRVKDNEDAVDGLETRLTELQEQVEALQDPQPSES